ncbi:phospholipase D-like domain-containing protein [Sphingomonas jatrophae]|uniref:Phospholipase D n=1 Tax=Sphingomonas jatrophae TaxID=1166337 RepID=A0A1I6LMN1_9SPHN|nr:phosphatidylserine/phosphatidylglycerophosphate/cardiolipin synthase family protein [Sphingomonas jatrophae]SFS04502.1 cardiolipin synthase [Sphingomonas jatrophae]
MADAEREEAGADGVTHEVAGNRLRLLVEGETRLEALIALIEGARKSLRLLYYIYTDDDTGRQVRDALLAAVQRGVRVSLIIDGFGSDADDALFAPLEQAGAHVCRFSPRFGRRYLLRNHQKLALADETSVIVGGFNVEADYFGAADDGAWRDLGLLVEGPAAARLAPYYDALEAWARMPKGRWRDLRHILKGASEAEGPVRWLMGGPTRRLSPWALCLKRDMQVARRIDLIAAYFAPNPAILRRIERVTKAGGTARVLTAGKSDNDATIAAARHTYARLIRRGVRVFEYAATKLHTKLFVVDDVTHIGSANLDVRSLYINLELILRVEDAGFAQAMRRYFEGELAASEEITRERHAQAGWLSRLRWGLAYFIVAVLDVNVTRRLNFGLDGR